MIKRKIKSKWDFIESKFFKICLIVLLLHMGYITLTSGFPVKYFTMVVILGVILVLIWGVDQRALEKRDFSNDKENN